MPKSSTFTRRTPPTSVTKRLRRLQISVNDAFCVSFGHRVAGFENEVDGIRDGKRTALLEDLAGDSLPLEKLHDHVR